MAYAEAVENLKAAFEAGRVDIFKTLLDALRKETDFVTVSTLVNQHHTEDGTFLHSASKAGLSDFIRVLLLFGADPQVENAVRAKPLSLAKDESTRRVFSDALFSTIAQQNNETFDKLFGCVNESGSVLLDNDEKRNTLLHWAASFGNEHVVQVLLESGHPTDFVNSEGLTPFHEAVRSRNLNIVEMLLKHGADPLRPIEGTSNLSGKTSFDLAEPGSSLRNLLESHRKLVNGHVEFPSEDRVKRRDFASSPSQESVTTFSDILPVMYNQIKPVVTDNRLHWLCPQPKEIQQLDGPSFDLEQPWIVSFTGSRLPLHQTLDIWDSHKPAFKKLGISISICEDLDGHEGSVRNVNCCVRDNIFTCAGSYKTTVTSNMISITASDKEGLHYALTTLEQLVTLYSDERLLKPLFINDSPSLRMRAVLLDVSPNGRIPTLDTLYSYVDVWSSLKMNQVHLFLRVSAVSGVDSLWPYSKIELLSLDRYCLERGIELIPALELHADVATAQVEILRSFIKKGRQNFPSSRYFHAGPQLSALLLQSSLKGGGILDDSDSDLQWMLCANSFKDPEAATSRFPHVIFIEYGFQADYNFHEATEAKWRDSATLAFCAGTASWDCIAGYPDGCAANIYHAAQASQDRGSLGSIVATWADALPVCPLTFAWPGWIVHAALSWNTSVSWDFAKNFMGDLISLWILEEPLHRSPDLGQAIVELGRLETWLLRESRGDVQNDPVITLPPNGPSSLHQLIFDPDDVQLEILTPEKILQALKHARKWHKVLIQTPPSLTNSLARNALAETIMAADLILLACSICRSLLAAGKNPHSNLGISTINVGIANLPSTFRTDTANKLLSLTAKFQELWTRQYQQQPSLNLINGLQNVVSAFKLSIKRLLIDVPSDQDQEI